MLAVAFTASLCGFTSCADKLIDEVERISSMITDSLQGEQTTYVQRMYRICPLDKNGQFANGLYGTNVLDTLTLLNSAKFFECLLQKTTWRQVALSMRKDRRVCIFPLKVIEGEDTIKKNR